MNLELEQKVRAQFERFEAELPSLMLSNPGEWVVWLDGPAAFFKSEKLAIRWAFASLPAECGFVVAQIATREPVLLTAAMAFLFDVRPATIR